MQVHLYLGSGRPGAERHVGRRVMPVLVIGAPSQQFRFHAADGGGAGIGVAMPAQPSPVDAQLAAINAATAQYNAMPAAGTTGSGAAAPATAATPTGAYGAAPAAGGYGAGAAEEALDPAVEARLAELALPEFDNALGYANMPDAGDPVTAQAMLAHNGDPSHWLTPPASDDPRFVAGTTGPPAEEGEAATVTIPDGDGFGGFEGREQNNGDKEQNNYSVTDANYDNRLGLLAANPDTGEPLNYVQHGQMYAAAGFIRAFAPEVFLQLAKNQNEGRGTVLGAAANIMGLVQTEDPAQQGVDTSTIPTGTFRKRRSRRAK